MAEGPDPATKLIYFASATPTLKELSYALDSIVDWYSLGVKLGLRDHELLAIKQNYHGDNERCKLEMLDHSLRSGKPPTWKAVVDALHLMGEYRVASKIQGFSSTDTATPLLKYLSNELDSVVNWHSLGVKLGLDDDELRIIEHDYRGDIVRCKHEVLSRWLRSTKLPTWKAVVDALQHMGEQAVASKIKVKYYSSFTDTAMPTLKELSNELDSVVNWHSLGVKLGLKDHELRTIEENYRGDGSERCKHEVLSHWLRSTKLPTWKAVVDALQHMGEHKVAWKIKVKYYSSFTDTDQGMEQDFPESEVQMKVAQNIQGQFGYRAVQLIKTKPLGTGSYGAVYTAMCDDLPCAGKILHSTLFQPNDPGAMAIMKRFEQECSFLSAIRHPNIVQYLGSYQDPDTRLPVLLMELMDESLTQFLEQSQEPLPYHTQVDICHDIALALVYLHSNGIIHRDLSSNNVLLIGRNKAKVTDFGMAKFFDVSRTSMTPQTMCPGTLAYMSPEALQDQPVYTKKLDTFSFGVLSIQIITRQFPDPGSRLEEVQDPRYPMGIVRFVPDTERRKSHIDLISPSHPLLPIGTVCLSYKEKDRPSAQRLCRQLAELKEAPQYSDSVQQAQERSRSVQSATAHREKQIMELRQQQKECIEQIKDLQHQLKVSDDQIREKDAVIAARQQEMQQLQQVTREKDHDIEIREQQLQQLNQQLTASQQVTAQLKEIIQESQEEKEHLQQQLDKVLQQSMVIQKGYLRGVDVIAEASVLITNQAQTFHWADYGLKLHVPQGALPAGLEECRLFIKVGLSGQFVLPQNTSLVSAVYWLDSEPQCKFLLPLSLEMQHCAMSSQTSRLSFALARCSQKTLPYTFEILDGGEFSSLSDYGCIQLQHFSLITLLKRKILGRDNVRYRARLYYIKREENLRDIHFVIIKDLKAHLKVVQQEYTSKSATIGPDTRVEFESETISLQLPSEEEILKGGWRILPLFAPVITKEDVDSYKPGQGIPSCQLTAEWTNEGKPSRLIHKVTLEGAKEPFNYFRIVLDCNSISSAGLHSKYPAGLDSEPKLSDLMDEIAAEIPGKWRDVGVQLGLEPGVLDGIATEDTNRCYSSVFTKWKNLNSTTHPYTWSTVVQALESRTVGEKLLMSKIKNKLTGHPPQ